MTEKRPNAIWSFFSSVRLTIVLLLVLAITSILGTIIPQQESAVEFAKSLGPLMVRFLNFLQLFDMYHSTWFRLLISCLSLNLIICSINRFPATLRLFRLNPKPDRSKPFEDLSPDRSFLLADDSGTKKRIPQYLKAHYGKMETKNDSTSDFFYVEKGRYSLFGVYLVHLSVLFILAGAIIGSIFGFEAFVNIPVGESTDTVFLRDQTNHSHIDLGFSVRCDDFFVDFYDNGTPKEFRSELNFQSNGKDLLKSSLRVNHPVKYKGITFYQSTYGTLAGNNVRIRITENNTTDESLVMDLDKATVVPIGGHGAKFQVVEVESNLRGMMGPAVMISAQTSDGNEIKFWVFQHIERLKEQFPPNMFESPMLNPAALKPFTIHLESIQTSYYTGMQVNKDPGVLFVWSGFILIMAGLIITFFTSHRRIWIRITREKNGTRISVAGAANKNPVGMERELDLLTSKLQRIIKG